jgi:DNA-directed RNA polymerase specialized sigma24 family protein
MADFPHPWDAYARLQAALSRAHRLSEKTWGTEAALDAILFSLQDNHPVTSDDVTRAAASERRRERHRARLRLVHLASVEVGADPDDAFAAREILRIARSKVSGRDWPVLCQLAQGYSYAEVAARTGDTPGSLRVRVRRCRQQLAAKAA